MDEILKAVAEEAVKHIDKEKLAKEIAPKLAKQIAQDLLTAARDDIDWGDVLYSAIDDDEFRTALRKQILSGIIKA